MLCPSAFPSRFFSTRSLGSKMFRSGFESVFFNFAVEEFMTQNLRITGPVLFLWRNNPTVCIGRHQNPWKECRLNLLEKEGVVLSRRYTGGGTIYQDKECLQFTFINPAENFDVSRNFNLIIGALGKLGIECEVSGRNDIVTSEGKQKISGSAFKYMPATDKRESVSLHHGTVLINTDMAALSRYLTPNKLKLASKGIASVAARVVNIKQLEPSLDHDVVCSAIEREFGGYYGLPADARPELLTADSPLLEGPEFEQHYDRQSDWNWRFGRTPEFSHNMETRIEGVGQFDVHCQVSDAKIAKVVIFNDALMPDVIDQMTDALRGVAYTPQAVNQALEPLKTEGAQLVLVDSFAKWFTDVMES
eukprot:GEMP01028805.1.p1 GENE.GEMP01028805.1~~GEMP01028805.1.p1  ORF type:complete len:362 (+),score=74.84 GEMP01028805.1:104-1189(+)